MANVIQIKHGTSKPVNGTLKSFELGFDEISKKLYIGDKNEVPILLTPEIPKIPTIENQTIKPANIIIKKNQHYIDDASGIDLQNSDIIGINGLYLNQTDSTPTPYEGAGIFFQSNNDKWNRLYEFEGELYYRKQVTKGGGVTPGETPRMIYHSGMTIAIPITEGGTGATTKADVIANIINGQSIEPSSIKVTGGIDLQNSNIININELSGESIKVTSIKVDSITFSSEKTGNDFAIDMKNSNIKGINSLRFNDSCQAWDEGIFFHRTGTFWDKLYALNGALYFQANFNTEPKKDSDANNYEVYHSGLFSYKSGQEGVTTPQVSGDILAGSTSKVTTIYLGDLAIEYGEITCDETWKKYTFKTIFSIPPIVTFTPCGSGEKPVPKLHDTKQVTEFDFVACLNSGSGTYFYLAIGPKLL